MIKRQWIQTAVRCAAIACLVTFRLTAAEYHGQVRFGGLPLPGATVTATRGGAKLVAVTDQQGSYSFPDLADGGWTVRVEMLCFAPLERKVKVAAGAQTAQGDIWDLTLLPLDQLATIARAAAEPLAGKAATSPNVSGQESKPQSSFRRTGLNAAANAGKAANEGEGVANETGEAAAGDLSQSASEGFLINGSVNNGAASPFMQAPAFGNNRRGGPGFLHGNAGVILDNSALDAQPFSLTGQNTPKPAYNHFEGVVSLGGPLLIPHVWNRNNAPMFFVGYQRRQNRNATTQTGLVPTLAERSGDFSQTRDPLGRPVQFVDPATGNAFPNNVIPNQRISDQARALLALYPRPNFSGSSRYNYQVPVVGFTNQDDVQSRLSKTIGRRNSIFGNFAYRNSRGANPNLFGFLDTSGTSGIDSSVNWMHRFGTRLFATFKYDFSRMAVRSTPYFAGRTNISSEAGITGNNQEPLNWGPPALSFSSGLAGLSDAQQSFTRNQTGALSFDGSWLRASHTLKFGATFRRQQFNLLSQQDPRGTFAFTGAATQTSENGAPVAGTGYDFADFLLGTPDTSSIAFGNADKYLRQSVYAAYVTDDWRIGPGLTVNLGLRWEYEAPITERYGRLVNLDIAARFSAIAPVVASDPTGSLTSLAYPDSLIAPDKHAFEPRLGIAWRPMLESSMVIRAGYGVYYNTSVYQSIATQMIQQSPLSKSLRIQNTPENPLTLANGFTAPPSITPNTFAVDPRFRIGYSQDWQLSIQRDLPRSLVVLATYLGTKGTRGIQEFLPNTYPAGALNPCPACPAGFAYMTSNGNSTREAAQIQLRRRLHNGFTASVQYTFAKAIDDATLGGRGQAAAVIAQNWLDLSAERSLSNFDQRHELMAQVQYTTGMGIGGGGLFGGMKGRFLKGWTFASQLTAGSGLPLTPIYFTAVNGTGVTGSVRPDYTGASLYSAPSGLHLNPAAYAAPATGQWGNAGRNSITGPAQFALNASFGRTFQLQDRASADLRFDATNALNHVTYPSWNTTVTGAQFGLPMSANAMRKLQATLRVRF